ncbi:unnamed protein product [Adineta ricciae]|uniref:Uncharacterized protein n=1 Tax=Adineta ricciae TaxID=249248 RepID=A0A815L6C8_ADIRI|nr:unnamed protein product [Adineta ricciae]
MDIEIVIDSKDEDNSQNVATTMPLPLSSTTERKRGKSMEVLGEKKKKGVFNRQWIVDTKFTSFLRECNSDSTKAICIACNDQFSIHHGGKNDIERHMKLQKHVHAMRSFRIDRELITSTMRPVKESEETAAAEGSLVYHGVKHGHSYRSQQCTTSVIKTIFSSSTIGKSMSCARTKSSAIATNVLAPYFTEQVLTEVKESHHYSIMFDASNKGTTKFFPVCVQYFSNLGVQRGIVGLIDDADESAVNVSENRKAVIQKVGLNPNGLTSIGADNTNVNMGNHHSVFSLLATEICNRTFLSQP